MKVTTMKDIAERLGVSINTVSKAINNKSKISQKTRELVLKTARELHYTPNIVARSLVKRKTNTLGVVIYDFMDSFYAEVLNGIEEISTKFNYNILVCNSKNDVEIEYKSIKMLFEKRVDGLLICPTQEDNRYIRLLSNSNIPFVLLNRETRLSRCNIVINDYFNGSYLAIDYLIKKGYRVIYFIYSHEKTSATKRKIRGCKKAFRDNNISLNDLKLIHCEREIELYYKTTKEKIRYNGKKIGIHVWDDQMAVGVCKAVIDKGLHIPNHVGIIGYDNTLASKYFIKPLTTVLNPAYDIGVKATELLIDRIKSKDNRRFEKIVLDPKLFIRDTA